MKCNKGIILAGGNGTRLYPITACVNKQLLPIYNKPTIYYPLSTLMLAGIRDLLIICNKKDLQNLKLLLNNGSQWGVNINYAVQEKPNGLAEAFIIGENFIDNQPVALILGDNIFYSSNLQQILTNANTQHQFATLFTYKVNDPHRYGIVNLDANANPIEIIEKPSQPTSNLAVTGLYFYDNNVVQYAKSLKPSSRGELEITDLNNIYLQQQQIKLVMLNNTDNSAVWFDVGTPEALTTASEYIYKLALQNISVAVLEEIAINNNWLSPKQLQNHVSNLPDCKYVDYLKSIIPTE